MTSEKENDFDWEFGAGEQYDFTNNFGYAARSTFSTASAQQEQPIKRK